MKMYTYTKGYYAILYIICALQKNRIFMEKLQQKKTFLLRLLLYTVQYIK